MKRLIAQPFQVEVMPAYFMEAPLMPSIALNATMQEVHCSTSFNPVLTARLSF